MGTTAKQIDQDVVLERNLKLVRCAQAGSSALRRGPDAITESLELEKGSGDVAVNSLPMDSLPLSPRGPICELRKRAALRFNTLDSISRPTARRCARASAIACAIDRDLIIKH